MPPKDDSQDIPRTPAPAPAVEVARPKWKTYSLYGSAFLALALLAAFGGHVYARASAPEPVAVVAVVEEEVEEAIVEDYRPVRGIDLARERELNYGSEPLLGMDFRISNRGRATEHYKFDLVNPEAARELHRPMVPRVPDAAIVETSARDVSASLTGAGRLTGIEPMAGPAMAPPRRREAEITFPRTSEDFEPRNPVEGPLSIGSPVPEIRQVDNRARSSNEIVAPTPGW